MHVFLIGYMGSGKSTLGKKITQRNGWTLVDIDRLFEETYRTTITLFFDRFGETKFRELERELLVDIAARPSNMVISTGGGTPCFLDNMQLMKQNGATIYLKLSPTALASRLFNSPLRYKRPLLKGLDKMALLSLITSQMLEREDFYNQADLEIDVLHLNTNEILNRIFERFPALLLA